MTPSRRLLCVLYGLIALFALLGTWSQNLAYIDGLQNFLLDAKANPAARSVTVDVILVAVSASFFMVYEARRLGIRFVWAYVFFAITVAISVTFPLFLIAREFKLAGDATRATAVDLALFAVLLALAAWLTWFTLLA
jgi:hypothetical protein